MPPRRKPSTRKKQDAILAKVAAYLQAQGQEAPNLDTATDRNYRSDDAVLVFLHHPAGFKPGICKSCNKPFAVNKKAVGYCSDPCRREDWRKTTGLEWRAISTHDVWDGDPPLIISPEQFEKLRALSAWFNTNRTVLSTLVEKPSEQVPELEFLSPAESNPEDAEFQVDPQVLIETALELSAFSKDELAESLESPQTNLQSEPSLSALALTPEEASLFEF